MWDVRPVMQRLFHLGTIAKCSRHHTNVDCSQANARFDPHTFSPSPRFSGCPPASICMWVTWNSWHSKKSSQDWRQPVCLFPKWSQQVNRKGHSFPSWQTGSHSNLVKLVAWTWPFFPTSSRLIEQPNTLNYCRIILLVVCRMLLDAQWYTCKRIHASNHTLTY